MAVQVIIVAVACLLARLVCMSSVGSYVGFGMKRGTILLTRPADLHITLQDCGTHDLPFLKLLFNAIKPLKSKFSALNSVRAQRYGGDLACNGTGEVLVLELGVSSKSQIGADKVPNLLTKLKGDHAALPSAFSSKAILLAWFGAFIAIASVALTQQPIFPFTHIRLIWC